MVGGWDGAGGRQLGRQMNLHRVANHLTGGGNDFCSAWDFCWFLHSACTFVCFSQNFGCCYCHFDDVICKFVQEKNSIRQMPKFSKLIAVGGHGHDKGDANGDGYCRWLCFPRSECSCDLFVLVASVWRVIYAKYFTDSYRILCISLQVSSDSDIFGINVMSGRN